jgi:hypothetical protein
VGSEPECNVAVTDTYISSPVSIPLWEEKMGYRPRAVLLRKPSPSRPRPASRITPRLLAAIATIPARTEGPLLS